MMAFYDREHIRMELVVLLDRQIAILEKETFGVATEADVQEYEDKRERVRELYEEFVRAAVAA